MDSTTGPYEEAKRWAEGGQSASHYEDTLQDARAQKERDQKLQKVVRAQDMPWERSRHGKLKHMVNERTNARVKTLDAYMQELPPGGRSGKHRHMWEEYIFVLEGRGYDLHWDVDVEMADTYSWKAGEAKRYDWQAGDAILIPVNTIHQHVNADPARPARFISAQNRIYKAMGFNDLEQLEDAP